MPKYVYKEKFFNDLGSVLDEALPKFNSGVGGIPMPMLAKTVNWGKVTYPCLVQPKLDGVRCLMIVNGPEVKFLSRSGKEYTTLVHIFNDVFEAFAGGKLKNSNFILDGEIYADDLTFQGISAAVKKEREDTLKLRFRAYDIVDDELQNNRVITVSNIVEAISSPYVTAVPTLQGANKEHVMEYHNHWVLEGYEGAMIRLKQGKYGQGQRSSDLLKVKEFMEEEFAFKNFEFGQRGVEDLIAVLWDGTGTKEFRAKMAGTKAHKEALYEQYKNGEGEGKPMTIKYFELTDDKLPRFPVGKGFRED